MSELVEKAVEAVRSLDETGAADPIPELRALQERVSEIADFNTENALAKLAVRLGSENLGVRSYVDGIPEFSVSCTTRSGEELRIFVDSVVTIILGNRVLLEDGLHDPNEEEYPPKT